MDVSIDAMEVSPKVLRDVQFREKIRGGYHPEDVDEFLEQAAVGIEEMQDRLRDATERAERAELLATEASANDEALKRMLLMGQRTVDQAIKEAREEAQRIVGDARSQAATVVAEAEERGRRAYESSLAETRAKMEFAATALLQAQQEQEVLRGWVDVNKGHLLAVLRDAQGLIENAGLQGEPPSSRALDAAGWKSEPSDAAETEPAGATDNGVEKHVGEGSGWQNERAPTGEWDSRLLDGVAAQVAPTNGDEPAQTGAERSVLAVTGSPAEEMAATPRTSSAEATVASDERALDSFFSGQDLGDERGSGRLRRRP